MSPLENFDLHPVLTIVGIPVGLAALALLIVVAGRAIERKYTDRKTAARFAAGALAAPHEDYSVFTPEEDPEHVLRVVHRDMPHLHLGSVAAIPSGFRSHVVGEDWKDYPTAREAAHAIAARDVEIQPEIALERRLSQTNANELARFRASPRG